MKPDPTCPSCPSTKRDERGQLDHDTYCNDPWHEMERMEVPAPHAADDDWTWWGDDEGIPDKRRPVVARVRQALLVDFQGDQENEPVWWTHKPEGVARILADRLLPAEELFRQSLAEEALRQLRTWVESDQPCVTDDEGECRVHHIGKIDGSCRVGMAHALLLLVDHIDHEHEAPAVTTEPVTVEEFCAITDETPAAPFHCHACDIDVEDWSGHVQKVHPQLLLAVVAELSSHDQTPNPPLAEVPEEVRAPVELAHGQEIGPEGLPMHTYEDADGRCSTCRRPRGTWPHLNE